VVISAYSVSVFRLAYIGCFNHHRQYIKSYVLVKVGMAEIFHLFFLCTNQSVLRSYFDLCLPFSPDDAPYVIAWTC